MTDAIYPSNTGLILFKEFPGFPSNPVPFFDRMNEAFLNQLNQIIRKLRRVIYSMKGTGIHALLIFTHPLLDIYGDQKEGGFNYRYQVHGYHPQQYYDGLTRGLLKVGSVIVSCIAVI